MAKFFNVFGARATPTPITAVAANKKWGAEPDEQQIESAWASVLEPAEANAERELRREPLPGRAVPKMFPEAFVVRQLLTVAECERLLEASEAVGYGKTNYPKLYRGNLRLITTDHSLADALWKRLRPVVPETVTLDGSEWRSCGLNECIRCAKYFPGDQFASHVDANFQRIDRSGEISMFTVNIYMNEDFDGGHTRFYDRSSHKTQTAVTEAVPETGMALIFRQPPGAHYHHDGELLTRGNKYLFRTDVMYRRTDALGEECAAAAAVAS